VIVITILDLSNSVSTKENGREEMKFKHELQSIL